MCVFRTYFAFLESKISRKDNEYYVLSQMARSAKCLLTVVIYKSILPSILNRSCNYIARCYLVEPQGCEPAVLIDLLMNRYSSEKISPFSKSRLHLIVYTDLIRAF